MIGFLKYLNAKFLYSKPYREISVFSNPLELRKYLFCQAVLKKGDYAIDVGAHRGLFTQLFAHHVGEEGKVFAYEPNPYIFNLLKKETANQKNVEIQQLAISDGQIDKISLLVHPYSLAQCSTVEPHLMNAIRMPGIRQKVSVVAKSLDQLIFQQPKAVKLIKIDVEGHEKSVLEGAFELIKRDQPLLIFEYGVEPGIAPPCTIEMVEKSHYRCIDLQTLQPFQFIKNTSYLTDIVAIPSSQFPLYQEILLALATLS